MKSKRIVLVLALTAAGCSTIPTSTTPITMQSGTPVPASRIHQPELTVPAPGRTAKVSFLRDAGLLGGACAHKILVGGKAVFAIRAGEYQTLYLAPGPTSFALEIEGGVCPKFSAAHTAVLSDGAEETYRIFIPSPTSRPRVAIIDTTGGTVPASSAESPFKWDSEYSAPGTSLTLREKGRRTSPKGTLVEYELTASGFSAKGPSTLWWKRGASFSRLPATIQQDGSVQVLGLPSLMIEGYVSGQPLDLALVSGDNRAHAKTSPFPIEAKQGVHWALVELMTETGLVFQISFGGFQSGEQVEVTSQHKDERAVKTVDASAKGVVIFPVMFGRGDRGTAIATATGRSGVVSIQYRVGSDALVRQ